MGKHPQALPLGLRPAIYAMSSRNHKLGKVLAFFPLIQGKSSIIYAASAISPIYTVKASRPARPLLPVSVRKHLQRFYLKDWDRVPFPSWPVDRTVDRLHEKLLALTLKAHSLEYIPFVWFWPNGYMSSAVMTHDVETETGRDFCSSVMDIDDSFQIKSSFQLIPEKRYPVPQDFLSRIGARGFEVCIHGLCHDGNLFRSHNEFLRRAQRINQYAKKWSALGYRSPVLYRNLDWYGALDFAYDMSVPNVAHLDPQRGG